MAWLELVDVSVALGGRDVIRGVSASVGQGELVVVVGPNGAGKTTLLRALAGPLVGITTGRGGRALELLGPAAFAADNPAHAILWVRIPRVLASLLVGGALAGAGCALQALLRNPLAEPFTLGISSGASLAAVLAIRLGGEAVLGVPFFVGILLGHKRRAALWGR